METGTFGPEVGRSPASRERRPVLHPAIEPETAIRLPRPLRSEAEELLERRLLEAQALDEACEGLARRQPEMSIRSGLSAGQRAGLSSLCGALLATTLAAPQAVGAAAIWVAAYIFACGIVLRLAAAISAALPRPAEAVVAEDSKLPTLTYLVPLYREANVAPALVKALSQLNYPAHLLDIKLLVEADDPATIAALRALSPPPHFEILPCPPAAPRTKPKALNYGLAFSRGEIVAVLDAEDIPDPQQGAAAARAFAQGSPDLAVVQAPLAVHNGGAGWIARQFEIEYAIHFNVWLPFVARLGWPMTLGGTSNYFRRSDLVAAGGWDPWNVTEDADLGLRLARLGKRAQMIAPPTLEEAPVRLRDWLAQRTRWKKGHLQSWLVLMRSPGRSLRQLGLWRFLGAQFVLGGGLLASAVHGPSIVGLMLAATLAGVWPPAVLAALLGAGYAAIVLGAMSAGGLRARIGALLTLPAYLPLISLAMARALWDMKARPHVWAKTPHGVTARTPPTPARPA